MTLKWKKTTWGSQAETTTMWALIRPLDTSQWGWTIEVKPEEPQENRVTAVRGVATSQEAAKRQVERIAANTSLWETME